MIRFILALIFATNFTLAFADENINSVLSKAAEAYSNEDCVEYSNFFVENIRQKKRREAGLFFASNTVKFSLDEVHVLHEEELEAEVAVSYSKVFSGFESKFSSIIHLKKENGFWKIEREVEIKNLDQKQEHFAIAQFSRSSSQLSTPQTTSCNAGTCPPQKSGCVNGKCSGPDIPFNTLQMCRDYGFNPIPCPGR